MMRLFIFLVVVLSLPLKVIAGVEVKDFADSGQEREYNAIIDELRCLVCQNQTIADSNADLAKDLRARVYNMVRAGKNREEIIDFMTQRYGDFVLYRPPFKPKTILLWLGPLLFLVIGFVVLINLKRAKRARTLGPIDADALKRAETILNRENRQ